MISRGVHISTNIPRSGSALIVNMNAYIAAILRIVQTNHNVIHDNGLVSKDITLLKIS